MERPDKAVSDREDPRTQHREVRVDRPRYELTEKGRRALAEVAS